MCKLTNRLMFAAVALAAAADLHGGAAAQGPDKFQKEMVNLTAQDKGRSKGVLFTPVGKASRIVILNSHPTLDRSEHFTVVPLAEAGIAVYGMASRFLNRSETIQEDYLLDIAAAIKYLREKAGFQYVVLLAHSGGAQPAAFYQSQAEKAPPARVRGTPAGDPPDLSAMDLPKADAMVLMSPTFGLTRKLDPSVADENDLYSVDPALDPYSPANGFKLPPEKTSYSEEFLKRYRAAQDARMARLDQRARDYLKEEQEYEGWSKRPEIKSLPVELQLLIRRRAVPGRNLLIHRTAADPKNVDISLDPSDRTYGLSLSQGPYADYPEVQNYSADSSLRMSPRAFLSSQSTISGNSKWEQSLAGITVPTLMIYGTADKSIYPGDARVLFEALASRQKEIVAIEGAEHTYLPAGPKAGKGTQRKDAVAAILEWVRERTATN